MGRKLTKFNTGWWFGTFFIFHILRITIPTDELIFFRGVGIPPTRIVQHLPTQGLPWPYSPDSEREFSTGSGNLGAGTQLDMFVGGWGYLWCIDICYLWLVVWNMNLMTFHMLGIIIIPTDFHSIIFRRCRSTTNQDWLVVWRCFFNSFYLCFYDVSNLWGWWPPRAGSQSHRMKSMKSCAEKWQTTRG